MEKKGVMVLFLTAFAFSIFFSSAQSATCSNGKADIGEQGVDCGGACSFPCPPGSPLVPSTCVNGILDTGEGGVDCGGSCFPCPPGTPTHTTVPGTCSNGVKDGSEQGIDCGGSCIACPPGAPESAQVPSQQTTRGQIIARTGRPTCPPPSCVFNWTCKNFGACIAGKQGRICKNAGTCPDDCETEEYKKPTAARACQDPVSCFDGIQNQDESDVDCGGICTAQNQKCHTGKTCAGINTNCFSDFCDVLGACAVQQVILPFGVCYDGVQNQGESDIDCGGPCPACATCYDNIKNGDETGIDCGGACAQQGKTCDIYMQCLSDIDCKEGLSCINGFCSKKVVIELPQNISWWSITRTALLPFWWMILLGMLVIVLVIGAYQYYETKNEARKESSPVLSRPLRAEPVVPSFEELPPFPETEALPLVQPLPLTELLPPVTPLFLPAKIEVPEHIARETHYREITLPLYMEKEKYKQLLEDLPLLSSTLLKKNEELFHGLMDVHYHKSTDLRNMRDAADAIYRRLLFIDTFLFEKGKKQHRIKFEQ